MIVCGGSNADPLGDGARSLGDGARDNPVEDRWTPLPLEGAPSPRLLHTATWTGAQMVVFGGISENGTMNDGTRYDPELDAWLPLPREFAPEPRRHHTAAWMGSSLLIWGGVRTRPGSSGGFELGNGAIVDL